MVSGRPKCLANQGFVWFIFFEENIISRMTEKQDVFLEKPLISVYFRFKIAVRNLHNQPLPNL